jgi:hypothetical protein
VAHGDAVADTGDTEKERIPAARVNTLLDEAFEVAHAHMAGNEVRETRRHPDKGILHFTLRNSG